MSLRTKIRELRLRDRLSQEELAQRVDLRAAQGSRKQK